MAKKYSINGVDCRCSISAGILISQDGKTAALNDYGNVGTIISIQTDTEGPYLLNRQGKRIDAGNAVAEAWGLKYPGDGPRKAERIDGNIMNTQLDNLKWVPELTPYTRSTAPLKRIEWMGRVVTVFKMGKVKYNGQDLPVEDHYHDPDTDCDRYVHKPFVKAAGLQLSMDDMMAAASYVGGDPAGMKCPMVLHIDFDPLNFDSSNLIWAERTSDEYMEYIEAYIDVWRENSAVANPGKAVPEFWFRPPFCPKEYQNWKANKKYNFRKP